MNASDPILLIHHAGDWSPGQVATHWVNSTYADNAETRREIDRVWSTAIAQPGRKLFDGPMCRLESWHVAEDRVDCSLSLTTYKAFWGTNVSHPHWADQFGPGALANPVGVSPVLETADGYLLFGRRNATVAYYPSRIHPFAGALEPADATDPADELQTIARRSGPDLFSAIHRELAEELALVPADIDLIRLTGVVEDVQLRQPELVFRVRSNLTRETIERQVDRDEHHHSVAIKATPTDVGEALRNEEITPVGIGAMLLWGRIEFGEAWFAQSMEQGRTAWAAGK